MTDLERLRDDDTALGAAFRSAEHDAPKAGATAALLTALSLGAVGAVGAASAATATATAAATTTATSAGAAGGGAAGAAIKTSTFAAAWKLFAVSAVVASGAVATVHVAHRDLAAPSTTASGTVLAASSPKPAVAAPAAPRVAVAQQPTEALAAPILEPSVQPALAAPVVVPPTVSPTAAEPSPLAMRAKEPAAPREDSNGLGNTATPQLRVSPPSAVEPSPLRAAEAPVPNASAAAASAASAASSAASVPSLPKDDPSAPVQPKGSGARVAAEVSALDGARNLLSSGRPAEALSAIAAYEKAFPRAVLGEEALALKVSALVRAGRLPEAESLGNAFLERSPSSPVASRVRRSLAAAKK
jgi:trimeric autotransporter adhesin